jgi:hypothetical protein
MLNGRGHSRHGERFDAPSLGRANAIGSGKTAAIDDAARLQLDPRIQPASIDHASFKFFCAVL